MTEHLENGTLIDYMHGVLQPEEDGRVFAHLESCTACRGEYDSELALSDMLRAYAAADTRELPPTLKARIWQRVRSERPSTLARLSQWLRPSVAVPMAAAIALAAYFGTAYMAPRGPASIDAAYYLQDHDALNSTVPFNDRAGASAADLETASTTGGSSNAVAVGDTYTAYAKP